MPQIVPAGDRALLVKFGDTISPKTLSEVLAFDTALRRRKLRGLVSTVPAYGSLLCAFDPDLIDGDTLQGELQAMQVTTPVTVRRTLHEVSVRYDGPDLDRVADHAKLSVSEVVALHTSVDYLVYAVGFAPGFTYCGELPRVIATPRLPSPRTRVEAGSVGVAGRQTGIYAVESPGGWNLIGRTELSLFDSHRRPPARFGPGDRIRFAPQ